MTCGAENCSDGPFFRSAAFDEKDYGDCGYIWYEDVKNLLMIVGVCVCVVSIKLVAGTYLPVNKSKASLMMTHNAG